MNRAIIILILALLVGAAYLYISPNTRREQILKEINTKKDTVNWTNFTHPKGKFSVELPFPPQRAADSVNDNLTHQKRYYELFVSEGLDGVAYMVNLVTYPQDANLTDHSKVYKDFINEMIAMNPSNNLVSSKETNYQGHDAVDIIIQNNESVIKSKLFLDGNTLIVLSRLAKPNYQEKGDFDKFISSFELLKSPNEIKNGTLNSKPISGTNP